MANNRKQQWPPDAREVQQAKRNSSLAVSKLAQARELLASVAELSGNAEDSLTDFNTAAINDGLFPKRPAPFTVSVLTHTREGVVEIVEVFRTQEQLLDRFNTITGNIYRTASDPLEAYNQDEGRPSQFVLDWFVCDLK